MSLKLPVAQLHGFSQLFQIFTFFLKIGSSKQPVAFFLIFLVEDHPSLKIPVAQLHGISQFFSCFAFLKIVCLKQPDEQIQGISAFLFF